MVALLDKKEASCVHEIVSRISQDYPQALIYSIKTSVEDFQYQKSSGKENKLFVQKYTIDFKYSFICVLFLLPSLISSFTILDFKLNLTNLFP